MTTPRATKGPELDTPRTRRKDGGRDRRRDLEIHQWNWMWPELAAERAGVSVRTIRYAMSEYTKTRGKRGLRHIGAFTGERGRPGRQTCLPWLSEWCRSKGKAPPTQPPSTLAAGEWMRGARELWLRSLQWW